LKLEIHQIAKVKSGYEYFFTVFDDEGKVLAGNQTSYIGRKPPDEKETAAWEGRFLEEFAGMLAEEAERADIESVETSAVDREVLELKAQVKELAMAAIKENSRITERGIATLAHERYGETAGLLAEGFVRLYVKEARQRKLIAEESFAALKGLVSETPVADLRRFR
jgi:cell division protein FtsI/penicillin-binding protein 2